MYWMYLNLFKTKTLAIFVDVDLFEKRSIVDLKISKGKQFYIYTSFCAPYAASLCLYTYMRLKILISHPVFAKLSNVMFKHIFLSITVFIRIPVIHMHRIEKSAYLNREEF